MLFYWSSANIQVFGRQPLTMFIADYFHSKLAKQLIFIDKSKVMWFFKSAFRTVLPRYSSVLFDALHINHKSVPNVSRSMTLTIDRLALAAPLMDFEVISEVCYDDPHNTPW